MLVGKYFFIAGCVTQFFLTKDFYNVVISWDTIPGGVLRDQSDGDDRMEAKLRTQKNP